MPLVGLRSGRGRIGENLDLETGSFQQFDQAIGTGLGRRGARLGIDKDGQMVGTVGNDEGRSDRGQQKPRKKEFRWRFPLSIRVSVLVCSVAPCQVLQNKTVG
jgi:hypothetical protein